MRFLSWLHNAIYFPEEEDKGGFLSIFKKLFFQKSLKKKKEEEVEVEEEEKAEEEVDEFLKTNDVDQTIVKSTTEISNDNDILIEEGENEIEGKGEGEEEKGEGEEEKEEKTWEEEREEKWETIESHNDDYDTDFMSEYVHRVLIDYYHKKRKTIMQWAQEKCDNSKIWINEQIKRYKTNPNDGNEGEQNGEQKGGNFGGALIFFVIFSVAVFGAGFSGSIASHGAPVLYVATFFSSWVAIVSIVGFFYNLT
jgi:hypothetical protein